MKYLLVIIFILCIACSDNKVNPEIGIVQTNNNLININLDNQDKDSVLQFSDFFSDYKICALEANENSLIGKISQLRYINDTIYILDANYAKALFVFNNKGEFVRKIGKRGKGPNEYINPTSFDINSSRNEIIIYDSQLRKILIFTFTGEFKRSISIKHSRPGYCMTSQNGFFYFDNFPLETNYILTQVDSCGVVIKKWMDKVNYNKDSKISLYLSRSVFYKTTDGIKFYQLFNDTIYNIVNGHISPYLCITSSNSLTNKDVKYLENEIFREENSRYDKLITYGKTFGISNYIENYQYIYFTYYNKSLKYHVFYDKLNNSISMGAGFYDDIFKCLNAMYDIDSTYMVSAIQPSSYDLNEEMKSNHLLKELIMAKMKLYKYSDHNNPVLIFFKLK